MAKRILVYDEKGKVSVADIEGEDELSRLQSIVGGYIQGVSLTSRIMLICNEDGKATKDPNPKGLGWIPYDCIFGPFVITRYDSEGNTVDLKDSDIAKYSR